MKVYPSAAIWSSTTHIGVVFSMLLRNIIFARFLSPDDFAVALTFSVVLSLFEYISNLGHENLMQRSEHGDEPVFQATMHSMMLLRALLVAIAIYLISPLIPTVLNTLNTNFNYALLAVLPLINGMSHLDHQRLHRDQNYKLTAKISLSSDGISIIIAIIAVYLLPSYWAFYLSLVLRHLISMLLSHIWAIRPYQLSLEPKHIKSLLAFGIPLLLVGALKFIGLEADKVIVANIAGLQTFSVYVLTLMLVVNGANVINIALSKIFIRRVSTAGNSINHVVKTNGVIYCYLLLPVLFVLGLFGEVALELIFVHQYSRIPFLIFAVCGVISIRSLNHWLNQTVIASTSTQLVLKAEIARVIITTIGIFLIYDFADLFQIIAVFGIAELIYFILLSFLLRNTIRSIKISGSVFLIYLLSASIFSTVFFYTHPFSTIDKLIPALIALLLFYTSFITFSKVCRDQTFSMAKLIFNARGLANKS